MRLDHGIENIEDLLESLFADDEGSTLDDIAVYRGPIIIMSDPECCTYAYTSYGG